MYSTLQPLGKYFKQHGVKIYDAVFLLHTNYTVAILLVCTCLLSAKQYFGNPIECLFFSSMKNTDFLNTLCWTIGTYVLNTTDGASEPIAEKITAGDGPRIYLRYYQWVVILFLLEAFVFYLPAYLWRLWEGERLQQLCSNAISPFIEEKLHEESRKMIVNYFSTDYKDIHICYALKYIFCELLNLLISIVNILVLDVFLNGFWRKYIDALAAIPNYDWKKWNRLSSEVFPKMAKCELRRYGATGTAEVIDGLCILPLNVLNEKIFAFLWPWFILIAALAAAKLLFRGLLLCSRRLRLQLFRIQLRYMPLQHLCVALHQCTFGDWFLLYKVSKNINPLLFRDVIEDLYALQKRELNRKPFNYI